MPQWLDEETHTPAEDTEFSIPREEPLPREEAGSSDEYNLSVPSAPEEEDKRHSRVKNVFLKPLTALVAATGLLWAAAGFDPFGTGASISPAAPLIPAIPAATAEQTATEEIERDPYSDDAFPVLPNPDPDFAGNYAWADSGTEEYLILSSADTKTFLVAGSYYKNNGITESAPENAAYDRSTNTLTLSNFNGSGLHLDGNLMGNGFKIRLEGKNTLKSIQLWGAMYGGSVTFTGTGSLVVGGGAPDNVGVLLQAENSQCAIMVDRGVTLEIHGDQAAVAVTDGLAEKGLYFLHPLTLSGGVPAKGTITDAGSFNASDGPDATVYTIMDPESGDFAKTVSFSRS